MATKITKREVINSMLASEVIKANDVWVGYLAHELELLDKKSENKKPTKAQEANEGIKDLIYATLKSIGKGTVTQIQNANEELEKLSNQKVSALLRQMFNDGIVNKTVDKKSTIFTLTEC